MTHTCYLRKFIFAFVPSSLLLVGMSMYVHSVNILSLNLMEDFDARVVLSNRSREDPKACTMVRIQNFRILF